MSLTSFAAGTRHAEVAAARREPAFAASRQTPGPLVLSDLLACLVLVAVAASLAPEMAPTAALGGLTWCAALAASGAWSVRPGAVAGPVAVLRAGVGTALVAWVAGATVLRSAADARQVTLTAALVAVALAGRTLLAALATPVRVVVAGDAGAVEPLLAELHLAHRRWAVTSVCVDAGAGSVVEAATASGAGAVALVPGRALDPAAVRRCTWAAHAAGLEVLVASALLDVRPGRVRPVSVGPTGLLRVGARAVPTASRTAKHALDRVLAAALIVAFLPLLIAVAIAVRWETPGRVIFAQQRSGRDGSPFTMYKFRTMHTDAEVRREQLAADNECDGVLFKIRDDPRVTRVGRVLRKYSLDELPQLLNVLRGEMSLVGPRPALPAEVARYGEEPRRRLAVRPGLTGLWQVSGRSDLSWDESVRFDLHYVDNWSWLLDLRILLHTVGAVLGHRGAY